MPNTPNAEPNWGDRIREARAAKDTAAAVYEQTVRDANKAGRSVSQIAKDIGRKDRTVITRILGETPGEAVTAPRLPVVIWLEAPGSASENGLYTRLERAMSQRGWLVAGDMSAWHLSRAGAACVHVNARATLDDDPVQVELMEAKEDGPYAPWRRLAGGDYPRIRRYDEDATNNAGRQGAYCLDEQHIARLVADLLA
ncbi:hypothetical protein ACFQ6U_13440 [Streptomyces sp. NPDC056465]|uniref:hypothetical protein n=1 Tax=Streptomyces sp. NPDC056465 TaxID=3345829 RepID=UPI0036CCBDB5